MTSQSSYSPDIDPADLPVYDMLKAEGACRVYPPHLMYPTNANGVPKAKAICATCPASVRATCLDIALKYEAYGVWGGEGESDRRRMRRSRRPKRLEVRAA